MPQDPTISALIAQSEKEFKKRAKRAVKETIKSRKSQVMTTVERAGFLNKKLLFEMVVEK
jgi:hypothetical protein